MLYNSPCSFQIFPKSSDNPVVLLNVSSSHCQATTSLAVYARRELKHAYPTIWDFPCSSVGKESVCNAGDLGLISGSGRSHGEGNGNLLQYSCLGNPMDRGAWRAIVHGVTRATTPQYATLTLGLFWIEGNKQLSALSLSVQKQGINFLLKKVT